MKKFIKVFKNTSTFEGLNEEEILSAINSFAPSIKSYQKNASVLLSGDTTQSMGLLLSGSLIVFQEDVWGHRSIMNKLSIGETFAEPFASSGIPLNISMYASSDSEILFLNLKSILSSSSLDSEVHSRIIENVISNLSKKTLKLNEKISHMNKRTTREKLLSYLSTQSQTKKSLEFDIDFNRQQLADYLGVERSAMTVELSKLQGEGILTTNRNHFILHVVEE